MSTHNPLHLSRFSHNISIIDRRGSVFGSPTVLTTLDNIFLYLAMLLLSSGMILGGGTQVGSVADGLLQLIAIPALLVALFKIPEYPRSVIPKAELALCGLLVVLPLAQLVPLPPDIWTKLPSGIIRNQTFSLARLDVGWLPLSLTPTSTRFDFAALIPPLAMFLLTLSLNMKHRRVLTALMLAIALLSALMGMLQVAQGPGSPLRIFTITNETEAVGLFANRNHFAALMFVSLPFATAWGLHLLAAPLPPDGSRATFGQSIVAGILGLLSLVILLAAVAMARSRAGLGLAMLAMIGCVALPWSRNRQVRARLSSTKLSIGAGAVVAMLVCQFTLYRILERFSIDLRNDSRLAFSRNTLRAALDFMPFGSGLGSFTGIYASREPAADALIDVYANHAHNDYLEVWLETGLPGLTVLAAFAWWLVWRTAHVWRRESDQIGQIDLWLARSASIGIALLMLHSLVDYPLRTGTLMIVFACACALLVPPRTAAETGPQIPRPMQSVATESAEPRSQIFAAAQPGPPSVQSKWPDATDWPEAWTKTGTTAANKRQDASKGWPVPSKTKYS